MPPVKHAGALPVPRLTALIDGRGNVTIVGAPVVKRTTQGRVNKQHQCTRCRGVGHNANNRLCPARWR